MSILVEIVTSFCLEELKQFCVTGTNWARELPWLAAVEKSRDVANKAARCRQSAVAGDVCAQTAPNVAFPLGVALGVKGFSRGAFV